MVQWLSEPIVFTRALAMMVGFSFGMHVVFAIGLFSAALREKK